MIQFGVLNKRRFSLKYPDGHIERFGDCNPQSDDRREVVEVDGNHYLMKPDTGGMQPLLPPGTMATNGYYDKEHDGWVSLEEFIRQ